MKTSSIKPKKCLYSIVLAVLIVGALLSSHFAHATGNENKRITKVIILPPKIEKRPHSLTIHDETRIDNYYWLRDDKHTNPEVLHYLRAENAYTEAMLQP